jgi:hypothetical protein
VTSSRGDSWDSRVSRRVTSQRAVIISGAFATAGLVCYFAPVLIKAIPTSVADALQNVAFGLMFPAIFSLIWERSMTPVMVDELVSKIGLKRSVEDVGVESMSLESDVDWDALLAVARSVEVYFDLDGTWWLTHRMSLQKAAEHGCRVRALVLDASDASRKKMAEALMDFQKNLRDESTSQTEFYLKIGADVRRSQTFPLSSVVVIDDLTYVRVSRVTAYDPRFLCVGAHAKRALGKAIRRELDVVWEKSLSA